MNRKFSYLFKNVGYLAISNFGGKILTFLLVPIYTKYLSTGEYGTYDLYTTTATLLVPILSVCMLDAMQRFALDKDSNKYDIFTIGFRNLFKSILMMSMLILINHIFGIFKELDKYPVYLLLYFASERFYAYFSNVSKSLDQVKDYAICGFINTVCAFSLNIIFLIVFHWGIDGYFLANILSFFIAGLFLMFRVKIWKYLRLHLTDKNQKKSMLDYSKHLIFNSVSWWLNNSIDRYIIIWLVGTSENGIYSVAYKIPTIISVVQGIFNQAWTLSAVKEFDDKQDGFYKSTYRAYFLLLTLACSGLIIFDQLIAKIAYSNDFYIAWRYVPFLLISSVFAALNAFLDSIFAANMDTKVIARSTIIGALVNILLNIILINIIGTMGAALSTMISYFVIWLIKHIRANKITDLNLGTYRTISSLIIVLVQGIVLVYGKNIVFNYALISALFVVLALVHKGDIKDMVYKILCLVKRKKGE